MSTLLCAAETWPMTVADMKKLEAAHHRWQRQILGVSWRDMVRNEEIRKRTGLERLDDILSKRRLRWFGHVQHMDDNRITKQALNWSPKYGRQKRGRPKKNWRKTLKEDLRKIEMDCPWGIKKFQKRKTFHRKMVKNPNSYAFQWKKEMLITFER